MKKRRLKKARLKLSLLVLNLLMLNQCGVFQKANEGEFADSKFDLYATGNADITLDASICRESLARQTFEQLIRWANQKQITPYQFDSLKHPVEDQTFDPGKRPRILRFGFIWQNNKAQSQQTAVLHSIAPCKEPDTPVETLFHARWGSLQKALSDEQVALIHHLFHQKMMAQTVLKDSGRANIPSYKEANATLSQFTFDTVKPHYRAGIRVLNKLDSLIKSQSDTVKNKVNQTVRLKDTLSSNHLIRKREIRVIVGYRPFPVERPNYVRDTVSRSWLDSLGNAFDLRVKLRWEMTDEAASKSLIVQCSGISPVITQENLVANERMPELYQKASNDKKPAYEKPTLELGPHKSAPNKTTLYGISRKAINRLLPPKDQQILYRLVKAKIREQFQPKTIVD